MQRKFITYSLLFFIPIIVAYCFVEYYTCSLSAPFPINKMRIETEGENIETLVLGSSQLQNAINPEWLSSSTLNLASGNQHHDSDFSLLKKMKDELPNLKTVIIEVSYSHFELAHNGPTFWKNSIYLKYYGVNNYKRNVYFKDKLLYLSNPKFFSTKLKAHYITQNNTPIYNKFAFNTNAYKGQFQNLDHDKEKIANMANFKINTIPNLELFENNTALYFELLTYSKENDLQVILCKPPMYKTYHTRKHPDILERRDSIIALSLRRHQNVRLFDVETDTTRFKVDDYWNQSHLNPKGAETFTRLLDSILSDMH